MSLRRLALVLLTAAIAASAIALPAGAKEDVRATLTTRIPMTALPGTRIEVGWKLFYVGEDGKRRPFGAGGVFVRLQSASGEDAAEAFSPDDGHPTGAYEASVLVPAGGIGDVEIGLMGSQSDAAGTRRADMLFPITNEPASAPAPIVAELPPSAKPPKEDLSGWTVVLAATGAGALAALAVALRRRRGALQRGA